jgi:hypothetical protein
VDATNLGSDMRAMPPMVDQIESRCGEPPGEYLVDANFVSLSSVELVSDRTMVHAPPVKPKDAMRDPSTSLEGDSEAIAAWRRRMGTDEAKEICRDRAATAECVNAIARNRGLQQIPVRGLGKAKSVLLLFALAHNMMRIATLMEESRRQAEGTAREGSPCLRTPCGTHGLAFLVCKVACARVVNGRGRSGVSASAIEFDPLGLEGDYFTGSEPAAWGIARARRMTPATLAASLEAHYSDTIDRHA